MRWSLCCVAFCGRRLGNRPQPLDQQLADLLEAGQLRLLVGQHAVDLVQRVLVVGELHLDVDQSFLVHASVLLRTACYTFTFQDITCVRENLQ